MIEALPLSASDRARDAHYETVTAALASLLEGEDDWVAAMATVACELHHAFGYFHWTGFYRVVAEGVLAVGPAGDV